MESVWQALSFREVPFIACGCAHTRMSAAILGTPCTRRGQPNSIDEKVPLLQSERASRAENPCPPGVGGSASATPRNAEALR